MGLSSESGMNVFQQAALDRVSVHIAKGDSDGAFI